MQIDTHTLRWMQGRGGGLGNGRGGRGFPGIRHGACVQGVQKCTSVQGPVVAVYTVHTLPPGSFPCLQLGSSLALVLGQALNGRCPHPLPAKQG